MIAKIARFFCHVLVSPFYLLIVLLLIFAAVFIGAFRWLFRLNEPVDYYGRFL